MPRSTASHRVSSQRGTLSVVAALLALTTTASLPAQSCTLPDPAAGSCASRTVLLPLPEPSAVTVIGSEQMVLVADAANGTAVKLPISDIASALPVTIAAPLGVSAVTGVAWHPTEDVLYWLTNVGGPDRWVRSTLDGTLLTDVPVTESTAMDPVPFGALAGLTWNPATNSFWAIDPAADRYFEFETTGVATNTVFTLPLATPVGGDAFGVGITAAADPPLGGFMDVIFGTPFDERVARFERVDATGDLVGFGFDLDATNGATGDLAGIASAAVGSTGGPVTFLVDRGGATLLEIPAPTPAAFAITDFACDGNLSNEVELSWTNGSVYDLIFLERDGVIIETFGGQVTSFSDLGGLADGTHTYRLIPSLAGESLPTNECQVVLGPGFPLLHGGFAGEMPVAVTVVESILRLIVVEREGGGGYRYDKDLLHDGQVVPSPFPAGEVTTGIAWNATADTLLWHDGTTGRIRETALDGTPLAPAVTLSPLPAGETGDVSFSSATGTYFGVRLDTQEVFEFTAAGTIIATCSPPLVDGAPPARGGGVAVVDPGGPGEGLDATFGPSSGANAGLVDRVVRRSDCATEIGSFDLLPTTASRDIRGMAWTPVGSNGIPSEYFICTDTQRIVEVDVAPVISLPDVFRRGDVNINLNTNIADPIALLDYLFNGSTDFTQGGVLLCEDAADANDDGILNLADAITILDFLFAGGPPIPSPPVCGPDPTADPLGCLDYPTCL